MPIAQLVLYSCIHFPFYVLKKAFKYSPPKTTIQESTSGRQRITREEGEKTLMISSAILFLITFFYLPFRHSVSNHLFLSPILPFCFYCNHRFFISPSVILFLIIVFFYLRSVSNHRFLSPFCF